MSYCKEEGKDRIIFVTKEDHDEPSKAPTVLLEDDDGDDEPGLINDDGSINWSCPCLGGMASGPCGPEFREAFSCFHYSTEEPKGVECYEQFQAMQDCMLQYPSLYDPRDKESEKGDSGEVFADIDEDKSKSKEDSGSSGDNSSENKSSSSDSKDQKS